VADGEGDYQTTAVCSGALRGLLESSRRILVPSETLGYPDPAIEARAHLGDRFDAFFEEGRSMTPDEIFAERGPAAARRRGAEAPVGSPARAQARHSRPQAG
jgi:hypothetical protein